MVLGRYSGSYGKSSSCRKASLNVRGSPTPSPGTQQRQSYSAAVCIWSNVQTICAYVDIIKKLASSVLQACKAPSAFAGRCLFTCTQCCGAALNVPSALSR